jgi:hypothetical protein
MSPSLTLQNSENSGSSWVQGNEKNIAICCGSQCTMGVEDNAHSNIIKKG